MLNNPPSYKKQSFWAIAIILLIVALCIFLASIFRNKGTSFTGATYNVEKILYQSPIYSFSFVEETAPQYCISSDYGFFRKFPEDIEWTMSKGLYEYPLKTNELYDMFESMDFLSDEVKNNLKNVKTIYRSDAYDSDNFYLVMEEKDGTVLVAEGYDSERSSIRWIFKLKKNSENDELNQSLENEIWKAIENKEWSSYGDELPGFNMGSGIYFFSENNKMHALSMAYGSGLAVISSYESKVRIDDDKIYLYYPNSWADAKGASEIELTYKDGNLYIDGSRLDHNPDNPSFHYDEWMEYSGNKATEKEETNSNN